MSSFRTVDGKEYNAKEGRLELKKNVHSHEVDDVVLTQFHADIRDLISNLLKNKQSSGLGPNSVEKFNVAPANKINE